MKLTDKSHFLLFIALLCLAPEVKGQKYKLVEHNDSIRVPLQGGSTVVIDQRRMNKGLVTNSLQALSGQAAGLNVTSGGADRMAMLSSVRLRGTTSLTGGNEPLVIIDGVYSDLSTLSGIYPADIESFTILKNASETASYGSRGASGVIQVTTKKGHDSRFQISYDGTIGVVHAFKQLDMLNAAGYTSTARQLGDLYVDGGYDTNFQKEILRTGFVQNRHIAFSGGSDTQHYRASLAYMNESKVVKNNGFQSFAAKVDLSQKAFGDLLTIDLSVVGSSQLNHVIYDRQKLFYSAAAMNPTFPNCRNSSGRWDKNTNASQIGNPLPLLDIEDKDKVLNFNSHIKLGFNLSKAWNVAALFSYSFNSFEDMGYKPTSVWAHGQADRGETKSEDWLGNVSVNYKQGWGNHHLKLTAMSEYQYNNTTAFNVIIRGLGYNSVTYHNLSAGSIQRYGSSDSDYSNSALLSFMAKAEYQFKDRYSLSVSARADGSSLFASGHKWGVFPSVSTTWDIRREAFLDGVDWLSQLKMRAGMGISGNLGGIEAYNSLTLLSPTGIVPWYGNPSVTFNLHTNPNPDLHWETRGTLNIGYDLGFLNNKVVTTAEYYYSRTHDMLYMYDVPMPPYPYPKMLANLGSMSNQGIEIGIGYTPIHTRDMELNINVNMSRQINKLISLSGDYNGTTLSAPDLASIGSLNGAGFHGGNNNIVYQIVGQPLGVFYLPHCTGLEQNADGTYYYAIADLDGNGEVNIEDRGDRYIAGQATPKWTLGSNISFRYHDFDVSLQMNGAFGHKIYNGTSLSYMNMGGFPEYNVLSDAPQQNIHDQTATDYWLEKGDYLNFDYVTVGWNIPITRVMRFISAMRLALSVNNIATITSYSGLTPMINSFAVNSTLGIDDKRSYPPYRSYSMSFSIQF